MLELLEPFRPHRGRVWRLIVCGRDRRRAARRGRASTISCAPRRTAAPGSAAYAPRGWLRRFANTSAIAPATNDARPNTGPLSEPPVSGSEPGGVAATVTSDAEVGVPGGAVVVVVC